MCLLITSRQIDGPKSGLLHRHQRLNRGNCRFDINSQKLIKRNIHPRNRQVGVKNGFIHNGKQNHRCNGCGQPFVEHLQTNVISDKIKVLIDKLLLEKIPLAGIARVVEVSEPWLQGYVNEKYASVPRQVQVRAEKRGA